jgi:hypothetical protein
MSHSSGRSLDVGMNVYVTKERAPVIEKKKPKVETEKSPESIAPSIVENETTDESITNSNVAESTRK